MKLAAYAAIAVTAASAAHAGGYVAPVVETPVIAQQPVAPVTDVDWSGFYAGGQWGKGNAKLKYQGDSADADFDAFGVHGGYQKDFGKYVLGGELSYDRVDPKDSDSKGDLVRLRARAGYDLGRVMPYVTLGAAHLKDDDLSETGLTYGIGADFKVTDRVTVGAEYSRTNFKDVANVDGADLDTNLVQLRAAYHF
ncbi:porin [Paracoccus limosus]|uniref:Porin n=1 Tax=Paracoccus limosus TaxID=913252 RepID=A0A844H4T8_9RHOB|nr:porin family protein [Paracoccus limosus]MTH35812.1 porin [Paracoccus limosus]